MRKRKKTKHGVLCLIILFNLSACLHAQVTMGSGYKPNEGALLDLKQDEEDQANSILGLLLPRVQLQTKKSLEPCLAANPANPSIYKGLVVYNVNPSFNSSEGEGIYIWDGVQWIHTPSKWTRSQVGQ